MGGHGFVAADNASKRAPIFTIDATECVPEGSPLCVSLGKLLARVTCNDVGKLVSRDRIITPPSCSRPKLDGIRCGITEAASVSSGAGCEAGRFRNGRAWSCAGAGKL